MRYIKSFSYFFIILILLISCATGSAIVTGIKREPIDPSKVKLYVEAPANYEIIGIVNASSAAGLTEQGSVNYAIEELKKQAADLGANGIILNTIGDNVYSLTQGSNTGRVYTIHSKEKTISGKAIFISE